MCALIVGALAPASAQTAAASPSASPSLSEFARSRVDAMLSSGHADPSWFSTSFLSQITVAQIDAIVAQLKSSLGDYKSVDGSQGDYTAHFAKGTDEVLVHVDAENKIDGILFKPMKVVSLDAALQNLQALPGTLSYVVVENGSEKTAHLAAQPMAVGSAFKLAVLSGLRDEIARKQRSWSDVVPLDPHWKTLPSGIIRTWPDNMPLTVATYAVQMISISDNMAADALVHLVGPRGLAPYAMGNAPFLTTRETFILKSSTGATQRAQYLAAKTPSEREAVLRAVDRMPLPSIAALDTTPILGIEWHYSVRQLCDLMGNVADLPLMSINPGVTEPGDFKSVAYKGGSDVGVINMTTQVTTKKGSRYCVSVTLNDQKTEVDEKVFAAAYAAVMATLAGS
jgi:beta-lactamase class A